MSYFFVLFSSFCFCVLFISKGKKLFDRRARVDENAIQSAHEGFVPRVGGLGIFLSLVFGFSLLLLNSIEASYFIWIMLTALPVFLTGLSEDLGFTLPFLAPYGSFCFGSFIVIFCLGRSASYNWNRSNVGVNWVYLHVLQLLVLHTHLT